MRRANLTILLASLVLACWAKGPDFFSTGSEPDRDAPSIQLISPPYTPGGVFNIPGMVFQVTDGGSGVDWTTLSVLRGGVPLTYTVTGDQASASFGSTGDGTFNVDVSVKDKGGNLATQHIDGGMVVDQTPPNIIFTGPTVTQFSGLSALLSYSGTATDAHLGSVTAILQTAGTSGACGSAGATAWPVGPGGGQVSENSWASSAILGTNGAFQFSYMEQNPAGAGSIMQRHCPGVTAADLALGINGAPNPNTTTVFRSTDLTWTPVISDNTPIQFINQSPAASLPGPFNISSVAFDVIDPPGSNGAAISGVDLNSIQVLLGPGSRPTTRAGNRFTVDIADLADGPLVLNLSGRDLAGNGGAGIINIYKKTAPPTLSLTSAPPSTWSSSNPSETYTYLGMFVDPLTIHASGALYRGDPDGTCVADQAHRFAVGTGPGNVSQDTWDPLPLGAERRLLRELSPRTTAFLPAATPPRGTSATCFRVPSMRRTPSAAPIPSVAAPSTAARSPGSRPLPEASTSNWISPDMRTSLSVGGLPSSVPRGMRRRHQPSHPRPSLHSRRLP